ncbi:MAG: hypothetical protein ACK58L_10865 [Planctomycetota bacterium]
MSKRFRSDDEPQDFGFLQPAPGNTDNFADLPAPEVSSIDPVRRPSPVSFAAAPVQPDQPSPASQHEQAASPLLQVPSDRRRPEEEGSSPEELSAVANSQPTASRPASLALVIYSIVVTILLIYIMLTGKSSRLESLPDIRPLRNNEFQHVPEGAQLPGGHTLQLGQSTRFGDVLVTPVKVTREPLTFENFMTKEANSNLTTPPVLKLHLTMKNVSSGYIFPPFDSGLMSHRSPPEADDDSAKANSFLRVTSGEPSDGRRFLNFLQSMDNPFLLIGQNSARAIAPGETVETFVASSVSINSVTLEPSSKCTWRVQIRKGVNMESDNGVTTLIDVVFNGSDVQTL